VTSAFLFPALLPLSLRPPSVESTTTTRGEFGERRLSPHSQKLTRLSYRVPLLLVFANPLQLPAVGVRAAREIFSFINKSFQMKSYIFQGK